MKKSHFPEYNLCWTKEKDRDLSSFEKQKEYDWALQRIFHQREDGYKETYNKYK